MPRLIAAFGLLKGTSVPILQRSSNSYQALIVNEQTIPSPRQQAFKMSLVLLKNLLFSKRSIAPSRKSTQTPPASPTAPISKATIPSLPLEKAQGTSWIETRSNVDLEAQGTSDGNSSMATESPECSKKQPVASTSSRFTAFIKKSFKALRAFRPTPRMISDAIIGISDGMTVPFALTAGLSSLGTTRIVVLGGVAELVAGMISMGVGGALGARAESYVVRLA